MRKIKNYIIIVCVFIVLIMLMCACANSAEGSIKSEANLDVPQILRVDGKSPQGKTINLSVEKSTDKLELFNLIEVTNGSIWRVFDADNNLIENKVVKLKDGNNTFYLQSSLPDGTLSSTYTLTVFKSYDITVTYVWWEGVMRVEHVLKKITVEQGELFKADYIPEITGYDFVSWHSVNFDVEFTEGSSTVDCKLVAKVVPKSAKLHLIVDGNEWQTIDAKYGDWVNLPIPQKEHYSFEDWFYDDTFCSFVINEYRCYNWGDVNVYGKFKANSYKITYDYGEFRNYYKEFKYCNYGEEFKIVEPNVKEVTKDGTKYVFSGFSFNGKTFKSGKYLYDGDITVTAIWLPA